MERESRNAENASRSEDMVSKMNVGIRPSEAEELFELFDTDASGGIDDREFMKALFPDDYRKLYIRTTTMASF